MSGKYVEKDFEDLVGKTIKTITGRPGSEEIVFITEDEEVYRQFHYQNCCESVSVDDIIGELSDLIGTPILIAYESTNQLQRKKDYEDSWTWTFYNLSTVKGHVTIKWYGSSNGYYSESVTFIKEEV